MGCTAVPAIEAEKIVMPRGLVLMLAILGAIARGPALGETLDIDSCVDAKGTSIPAQADPELKVLVDEAQREGRKTIRYNPDLLPDLPGFARQFFYAYGCARASLGPRAGAVRAADCAAAQMLLASGALGKDASLGRLQEQLVFSEDEWKFLPGPRRRFDFGTCSGGKGLILSEPKPATPVQQEWDACVRQCGDRLYRCPAKSPGTGCQEAYDRCYGACAVR